VDFLKLQKYHGIGQTLVSKTAVIFTPKQPRLFNTRVFFTKPWYGLKTTKILCMSKMDSMHMQLIHIVYHVILCSKKV
jgi:hypothetical protein